MMSRSGNGGAFTICNNGRLLCVHVYTRYSRYITSTHLVGIHSVDAYDLLDCHR